MDSWSLLCERRANQRIFHKILFYRNFLSVSACLAAASGKRLPIERQARQRARGKRRLVCRPVNDVVFDKQRGEFGKTPGQTPNGPQQQIAARRQS